MRSGRLTGREAEELCAGYLRGKGYTILERNYVCRGGELDIVAEQPGNTGLRRMLMGSGQGYLVFVEVKYRSGDMYEPREAVGYRKQQRLRLAAQAWIAEHGMRYQPRFDVIEVRTEGGEPRFDHFENAF